MPSEEYIRDLERQTEQEAYEKGYKQGYADRVEMEKALREEPCEDCISREQAIYIASGYCHPSNVVKELKKLPSVKPIEPCEDCISREMALKEAYTIHDDYGERFDVVQVETLEGLPSVKPTGTKGKWIEHEHEAGLNWEFSKYECNVCHAWSEDDSDYCPYCGTDMRGEEE